MVTQFDEIAPMIILFSALANMNLSEEKK